MSVHALPDPGLKLSMAMQRSRLLETAVRYVREGRDGSPQDRLRTASDLSGIPKNLIESESKR